MWGRATGRDGANDSTCLAESFLGVLLLPPLEGIHALHAMNTPVTHRLTPPDMRTAELAAGLQEHLNAQKENR